MTVAVDRIVDQVRQLNRHELDELLDWLADRETAEMDTWDQELMRDSRPGGRLEAVMSRARGDIAEGRVKPLDEVVNHS